MTSADLVDLLSTEAEDEFPGWRPIVRALRRTLPRAQETVLWDRSSASPHFKDLVEKLSILEFAKRALCMTCEKCGALGSRMEIGDFVAIRCAAHCDQHPNLPGVWESLAESEWVMASDGDVKRLADLSATDRKEHAAWLREAAPELAAEAQGRALVAAHHSGTAREVKAALKDIPANDPDEARRYVENSLLYRTLTQQPMEDVS